MERDLKSKESCRYDKITIISRKCFFRK